MSKIIIENNTNIADSCILEYVSNIIAKGRISNDNKQYCYVTTYGSVEICSYLNKGSDRFVATEIN